MKNSVEIKWRSGYPASHIAADVAYAETERLRERDGEVTAESLLTASKPKRAKLHGAFEWDDSVAAQSHRLAQARGVLNALKIVYLDDKGKESTHRAYSVVTKHQEDGDSEPTKKVYYSTEAALADPVFRAEILQRAAREAQSYRTRYAELSELAGVITEMDLFLEGRKEAAS